MTQFQTIFSLALVTFAGAAAWALWQYQRVRRAQDHKDGES